jgi:alkanesulfonate monooxygenase SsuD/methylene tetrahydromethanopterin reductase-like flavin-dependent oxidoreductase (luciferase family)
MYREMLEQCAWADRLGFDAVVFGEHHGTDDGYLPSAVTAAAAVAGRTAQLKLRPMIMAPFRDPLAVAEELAVLDLASAGRVTPIVLGGYVRGEFAMFGVSRNTHKLVFRS